MSENQHTPHPSTARLTSASSAELSAAESSPKSELSTSQNMQLGGLHAPGSRSAINAGCRCPRMDNHYGAGIFQQDGVTYYVMNQECPLHGHAVENPGSGGWQAVELN